MSAQDEEAGAGEPENPADLAITRLMRFMSDAGPLAKPMGGPSSSVGEAMLAYGWWVRTVRTAEAVRLLHRSGLEHEAAPLVRTVIQHSVALIWLADERIDAYEAAMYRHFQRELGDTDSPLARYWRQVTSGDRSDSPTSCDAPESLRRLENFRNMCDHVDRDNSYVYYALNAYQAYSTASIYVHPSAGGANSYLDLNNKGIALRTVASHNQQDSLRQTGIFAVGATKAFLEFFDFSFGWELIEALEKSLDI